jgi:hypothetical protein
MDQIDSYLIYDMSNKICFIPDSFIPISICIGLDLKWIGSIFDILNVITDVFVVGGSVVDSFIEENSGLLHHYFVYTVENVSIPSSLPLVI